jgi:hypothetical protein
MRQGRKTTRGKGIAGAVVVGACLFGLLVPGGAGTSQGLPEVRRPNQILVTTRGTDAAIDAIDARLGKEILESRNAYALGGWNASGGRSGARTADSWASYAEFRKDLARHMVPPDLRAAMYDPEMWDATPVNEQRDPVTYARKFAELAHAHGLLVITTPQPNLVEVEGAACGIRAGESEVHAYVRCGIAAGTARYADVYETQAQALERDPQAYRAFVLATAVQARKANPNVAVLSGLSTSPGYPATAGMLYDAWSSVADVVDGHYLSLARLRYPSAAAEFLAQLPRSAR